MMKNFTLTLILFFSAVLLQANPNESQLVINSKSYSLIRVSLDHGPLSAPSSSVRFNNLYPGKHWIKVKTVKPGYGQASSILVYKGFINIAPQSKTRAAVNRFGKFNIQAVKPLFQMQGNNLCGFSGCGFAQGHGGIHGNFQNYNSPSGFNACGHNGCTLGQGHHGIHSSMNTCGTYYSQSYNNYGNTGWMNQGFGFNHNYMSHSQFQSLKQTLRNQSFDSTRMRIAKQVISQNYFTTAQVGELIRIFDFDSRRLELAKLAYARTVDKENYYSLSNAFTFNGSINELMSFIGNG